MQFQATDLAGNVSVLASKTFTLDTQAPTIAVTSPANNGFTTSATVTGTVVDLGGAGRLASLQASVDGGVSQNVTVTNGQFTLATGLTTNGLHTVTLMATDNAGNVSAAPQRVNFTLDTVAPAISLTAPTGNNFTNSATLIGSVTDATSGMASLKVQVDGGALQTVGFDGQGNFSFNTGVTTNGVHSLQLTATDNAGNVATSATISFTLDPVAPIITITGPTANSVSNTTTITGSVTDTGGSGVASLLGAVDNTTNFAPITFDGQGNFSFATGLQTGGVHTIHLKATDNAGNIGTSTLTYTLDTIPPTITISTPAAGSFINNATITGTVADAGAAVTSLQASVDGGALQSVSFDVQGNFTFATGLSANGSHTVQFTAKDAAGNVTGTLSTITFTLDTVAPAITISSPANNAASNSTTIAGAVTDARAGVAGLQAVVDGGNPVNVILGRQGQFTFSSTLVDGTHIVQLNATDNAGNTSTSSVTFTLDTVAPTITIASPANNSFTNSATITGTVADIGAGVATLLGTIDGGNSTVPITFDGQGHFSFNTGVAAGTHSVLLKATDLAGNTTTSTVSFTFELQGPTITITSPTANGFTGSAIVTGAVADISGVTSLQAAIDGGAFAPISFSNGSFSFSTGINTDGVHTIQIKGTNGVGLTTVTPLLSFTYDTHPPVITVGSPPANGFDDSSFVTGTVIDALSGVATAAGRPSTAGRLFRSTLTMKATSHSTPASPPARIPCNCRRPTTPATSRALPRFPSPSTRLPRRSISPAPRPAPSRPARLSLELLPMWVRVWQLLSVRSPWTARGDSRERSATTATGISRSTPTPRTASTPSTWSPPTTRAIRSLTTSPSPSTGRRRS